MVLRSMEHELWTIEHVPWAIAHNRRGQKLFLCYVKYFSKEQIRWIIEPVKFIIHSYIMLYGPTLSASGERAFGEMSGVFSSRLGIVQKEERERDRQQKRGRMKDG